MPPASSEKKNSASRDDRGDADNETFGFRTVNYFEWARAFFC